MRRQISAADRRGRRFFITSMGVALLAAGLSTAPPAVAAVKGPSSLSAKLPNSATPVLAWNRSAGATSYQVQVDNDPSFGSPEVSESTRNSRFVPSKNLSRGAHSWRVRAEKDGQFSSWSGGTFSVAAVNVPVGTSPVNGAVLPQPDEPPLLRWQTSRGAVSYTVEVDGDADFIGAKSYTSRTTSLALPEALPAGDYFWRVTASLDGGINSLPSPTMSFVLGALQVPTPTYPLDDINGSIEDVVFQWTPVPGAQSYDLQVATDSTFNNFAYKVENLRGARYSPPTTLYNDQFWWRVRAVDLAGQATAWGSGRASFKRDWLDKPTAVWPTGSVAVENNADVVPSDGNRLFFQWTPVDHASRYEVIASTDANFSSGIKSCTVIGTTFAPRNTDDCSFDPGTVFYWMVRPIDTPYQGGLPGILSNPQKVTWAAPSPTGPPPVSSQTVTTGLTAAMTGTGAATGGCPAEQCGALAATPVLRWDKMSGATSYTVFFGNDANFTTTPVDRGGYTTTNNFFTLRAGDARTALPESEAGQPYFWFVRPCWSSPVQGSACGPNPNSQNPPLPGAHSFVKASPSVQALTSSDPSGSAVAFTWQDYLITNQAVAAYGELGQQSARTYRIEVDTEPSFSDPLVDSAVVDQTTYTSGGRLYPEGRLYWRVQALDDQENGLAWSTPAELIKASPTVALRSPVGGAVVAGTVPMEWQPQAFAQAYDVEIYRDNDSSFSPVNKVASARVANSAYTTPEPLPASATPYVWRVRRIDSSGNLGPWSAGSFTSLGSAPELLAPGNGAWQAFTSAYFEWSDVVGAANYQLSVRTGTNNTTTTTVGTAAAPSELATGTYTWQVTALDAGGKSLGVSAPRTFRVDSEPPKVLKVKPGKLKAKSDIKITFSEPVRGATKKTVRLKKANPKGKFKVKVKAKVKVKKGGRLIVIDSKKGLKKGSYQIVFTNGSIKDVAGNSLIDKTVAAPSR